MSRIIKALQEKYGDNFHKIDGNDPNQNETVDPQNTFYLKQASVSSILAAMNDYVAHHHEDGLPNSITAENLNSIFKNIVVR